jgi:hypothetical protein
MALFLTAGALVSLTPVGADEAVDRARICRVGFARAGRPSEAEWQRLKAAAMARAGLPWSERNNFELDHRVSLCLGGASTLDNLALQPWAEARLKDHLEAVVCRAVCEGTMELYWAQKMMYNNWQELYRQVFGETPDAQRANH